MDKNNRVTRNNFAPFDMRPEEFRKIGHQLVDQIAQFLESLPKGKITSGDKPDEIRMLLGKDHIPKAGTPANQLLQETAKLLFNHSLFNGHPRFWGYITSSAAPIGSLADLLASSINPNLGAWSLSPMASEIESQTIQWIAQLIGYPTPCSGLLVSGGNMANFVGFLAGRCAKVPWDIRSKGLYKGEKQLTVYVSKETHTWIQKSADLFGLGTDAIRWIPTDEKMQIDINSLEAQIQTDRRNGCFPFLVVGTAGTVGVGAIDPLSDIVTICRENNLWFHVDGAYGAPAAMLPEASTHLKALCEADSVAIDPHKWLYAPLEAGCTLVKNPQHLIEAFSFHPEYYNFDPTEKDAAINYYEMGPQNSRGFRALKVWLGLRQVGKDGYIQMIRDDIALAKALYEKVQKYNELQAFTHNLSITTFRYVPLDLSRDTKPVEDYLNDLNQELLNRLQAEGEVYVSNAIIEDKFVLRACIVNFRTTLHDIEMLPETVIRVGNTVDVEMRRSNTPSHSQ